MDSSCDAREIESAIALPNEAKHGVFLKMIYDLESTDAAGRVPHSSPTRPNVVDRASMPRLSFFFLDSLRLGSIRAKSDHIGRQLIQPK